MDFGYSPYSSNVFGGFKAPNYTEQKKTIPQQQTKQYTIQGKIIPGVDDVRAKSIVEGTSKIADPVEKQAVYNLAVQEAMKNAQADQFSKEKEVAKADLMSEWLNTKDNTKRAQLGTTVKLANIADMLRTYATSNGVSKADVVNMKDADLIGKYLDTTPEAQQPFMDYMGGSKDQISFGRELGLIKEEEQDQSHNIFDKVSEGDILPYANPAYKYTGTESGLEYLGGMAANVPGSAWNIVAGLGNMARNPVDTAKGLAKGISGAGANAFKWGIGKTTGETDEQINAKIYNESNPVYTFFRDNLGIDMKENEQVADSIGSFMANRYGGWEEIKKTMKEDPAGVIGDAISVLEGGVNMAGKAGLINEASKVSMLEKLNAVNPYTQIPSGATKVVGGVLKGTGKGLSNLAEATLNKITAIDKEDRVFATQNPELVNGYVNGTKTVDDIANTLYSKMDEMQNNRASLGAEYENVRNGKGVADTSAIIDNLTPNLESKQIKVNKNGDLEFGKFSKFNAPQQKAIQNAWQIIKDAQSETMLDVDSVLNIRQKMDDLINWEGKSNKVSAVDKEAESVIKSFRGAIDEQAKAIPGMVELDSKYGPALQEISTMKKDWFNTDGTLKDNALSKLKNLTNDANKSKLERLEKLMPGITQDIRALKVGVAVDTAMKGRVAQYAQQMLLGGGVVSIFANPSLIVPLVAAGVVLTPKNLIKVLQWAGQGQKEIGGIVNKIKSGMKLTSQEESIVGTVLKENQSDIEKVKGSLDLDTNTTNVSTKNNMSNTNNSNNAMKTTTKQLTSKTSDISVRKPVVTMKTPEEPLMVEARKYKSAEEFVKAQGESTYHGSSTKREGQFNKPKEGVAGSEAIFVSPDEAGANYYNRGNGDVKKTFIDKNSRIFDYSNRKDIESISKFIKEDKLFNKYLKDNEYVISKEDIIKQIEKGSYSWIQKPPVIKELKKLGYDGFKNIDWYEGGAGESIGIFSPDKIKTESQLKQIREEANKITPEEPLMAEARKYKTPEEFIKNQKTEGDLLFHGTDKGFTNFDEAKMSNGNQGKGIYLTDNGQHASYYSSMNTRQNQVRLDMLNMKQGGDIPTTPDFRVGDIMTVKLKKGANIKQLDYVPTEEQAQKFKEQGYDGIRFSDKLLDKAEDRNTKLDIKNPKEANTTVIFNKDVLSLDKTAKQIREEANKSKGLSNLKPMEAKASNPVVQMKTPEEPLMIEARKYKSAEEFMENGIKKADEIGTKEFGAKDFKGGQIKIYHQTNGEFEVFDKDIPTYFNTKKRLSTYGRNTIEGVIDIKKPLNMGTEIRTQTEQPLKIEKARKKGYDAITFTHYFDDDTTISQIIAIKPLESVKTKSQLKQIREEANKKKPLQPNQ